MFSFLIFCKYYRDVTCLLYHATIPCQGYYPDFFSSYYIHFFTFFTKFYNQLLQKYYIYKLKVDKWNIFYYSNYSNNYHYQGGYRMATLKYSRQRASIKEYLDHTTEHPTADTVYLHVREEFPRISLGTVYRNLNLLADMTVGTGLMAILTHTITLYALVATGYLICISTKLTSIP